MSFCDSDLARECGVTEGEGIRVQHAQAGGCDIMRVRIETREKLLTNDIKEQIKLQLSSIEEEFSTSKKNSALYKFNSSTEVALSSTGIEVFNLAKDYYSFSNGKFNPAIYPLSSLWHFTNDTKVDKSKFTPPQNEQILKILDNVVVLIFLMLHFCPTITSSFSFLFSAFS